MADNTTLNLGTEDGDTYASDDIGGVKHQRVKVQAGADGAATDVSDAAPLPVKAEGFDAENAAATNNPVQVGGRYDATPRTLGDGDVGAVALDADGAVQIADGGNTITVDGTVTANAGTGTLAVSNADLTTIAAAVSTEMQVDVVGALPAGDANIGNVDIVTVPAPLSTTGGGTEAAALRVTLANDSTGVVTVDGTVTANAGTGTLAVSNADLTTIAAAVSTEMQVDVVGALPAGDANIGNVDIVTVPAPLSTTGGGTEAAALRVTLANDSTGVVTVDDGGGALTIDGTVTANAGTGTLAVSNADITTVAAAVATEGSALGSGVLVQGDDGTDRTNVLVDTDGHLQVDVLSGGGGGTQYTEDAASSGGETGTIALGYRQDADTSPVGADGDFHAPIFDNAGNLKVNVKTGGTAGTQYAEDSAGAGGETGTLALGYRQDSDASPVNADGDLQGMLFDATGNLKVNIKAGAGSGGTASTDDAAFGAASGSGTPAMGFVSADTVDSGDVGVLGMDTSRNLKVSIEVDNVGIGGGTQYTEDAASAANPVGNALIARRRDSLSSETTTDGDNVAANATDKGELYVKHVDSVTVTGTVTANAGTGTLTTDNAGTFVVQEDGAALTALQLIDDVVYTDDTSTHATGTSKGALVMAAATPTDGSVEANDIGAVAMSTDRRLLVDSQIVGQDANLTTDLGATDTAALASIDTATTTIAAAVSTEMQVDVVGSLPAGDLNIGNVDIVTVPAPLSTTGGGTEAAALRVTLASDSTGQVTVDGTVTANAGTGTMAISNADITSIKTAVEIIDNIVSGSEAQVDVVTQPARVHTTDRISAAIDSSVIMDGLTAMTPAFDSIDAASSGDNTLLAAQGAGNKIRVLSCFMVSAGTVNARFESGAGGTALTGQMNLVANSGFVLPHNPHGWFETADNALLNLELSAAISVDGAYTYVVV